MIWIATLLLLALAIVAVHEVYVAEYLRWREAEIKRLQDAIARRWLERIHARLEPKGIGRDLEFAAARQIVRLRLDEISEGGAR